MLLLRSGRRRWGAFASALVLLVATVTAAEPASAHGIPTAPVLSMELTTAGFVVPGPNPRPAGPVTFRLSTQDARGHFWSTFKVRGETTLTQVLEWFSLAHSPDKNVAIPALRSLYTNVEFTGGAAVHPSGPIGLTANLTPGLYFITDYLAPQFPTGQAAGTLVASETDQSVLSPMLAGIESVLRAHAGKATTARTAAATAADEEPAPAPSPFGILFVEDRTEFAVPPAFQAVLNMREVNGAAVYQPIGRFRARGAFLFRNATSMPQEVQFEGVVPGATDRDVQNYYNFLKWGGPAAPNPFPGIRPGGALLLSPDHWVVVQTEFAPGRYCGLSFVTNWNTAVQQAYEGVHVVIQMH